MTEPIREPGRLERALVTGASSGIGREVARELASRGWPLVITARSEGALMELAAELRSEHGVDVGVIAGDLTEPDMPARLEEATEGAGGPIGLLVNNAGFGSYGDHLEHDLSTTLAMVRLNVTAVTELSHRFGRAMVERGRGRILNVASVAGLLPGPWMTVYYATKAYVISYSEGLREELRDTGVTVTTLCPGHTRSGFHERADREVPGLFEWFRVPTSAEVARFGVDRTLRGRGVVVHGWLNRVLDVALRFTPRTLAARLSGKVQERPDDDRRPAGKG